jgi:hypothetical protein
MVKEQQEERTREIVNTEIKNAPVPQKICTGRFFDNERGIKLEAAVENIDQKVDGVSKQLTDGFLEQRNRMDELRDMINGGKP